MAAAWEVPGLRSDARFADAAGRVILTRWREMMSYRQETLAGDDIEALHAMRVSSRRLRAAMDAFAGAFPGKSFVRNLREVKRITDTLAQARDLDVAIAGLTAILDEMAADERPGIEGLIAEYRARRAGETEQIARLFERIDRTRFAPRFESWVAQHTGVRVKRLNPHAPGGAD